MHRSTPHLLNVQQTASRLPRSAPGDEIANLLKQELVQVQQRAVQTLDGGAMVSVKHHKRAPGAGDLLQAGTNVQAVATLHNAVR